jgi:hypothetical protein
MISTMQQCVHECQMRTNESGRAVTLTSRPNLHATCEGTAAKCAVYVFSLAATRASGYGSGTLRVLKQRRIAASLAVAADVAPTYRRE